MSDKIPVRRSPLPSPSRNRPNESSSRYSPVTYYETPAPAPTSHGDITIAEILISYTSSVETGPVNTRQVITGPISTKIVVN